MRLALTVAVFCFMGFLEPAIARSGVETALVSLRSDTASDTLRFAVTAGEPLIVRLPPEHQGRSAVYSVLRAPALSWLVDRSFFWRTLRSEHGTMHVILERRVSGLEPDTVVLAIRVGS